MRNSAKPKVRVTERLLRRTEAADYITATFGMPCSPKTLAKIACVSSDGPPFRLAGRFPMYAKSDLDTWVSRSLDELMEVTFRDSTIDHDRHPGLLRLIGAKQDLA